MVVAPIDSTPASSHGITTPGMKSLGSDRLPGKDICRVVCLIRPLVLRRSPLGLAILTDAA